MRIAQLGALYAISVFAVGFVLGAVRVLVVEPQFGALAAVLIETPVMLGASWVICGAIMRGMHAPPGAAARLCVGAVALAVLLALEGALAMALGQSPADFLAAYRATPAQVGLAAQVVFALMPWLQARLSPRP